MVIHIKLSGIVKNQIMEAKDILLNRVGHHTAETTSSVGRVGIPSTGRNIRLSEQLLFRIWIRPQNLSQKSTRPGVVL